MCEDVEVQVHIMSKGKLYGVSTVLMDSHDSLQKLTTDIGQDLIHQGFAITTSAHPKQNMFTLDKIIYNRLDLMAPELQQKTIDDVMPKKKTKSILQRVKELYEPKSVRMLWVSVELV
jgi:hypothetical protein